MTDTDLSPRVIQLARIIDRLQSGSYEIHLVKPEDRSAGWRVSVVQPVTIRETVLNKPVPPPIDTPTQNPDI